MSTSEFQERVDETVSLLQENIDDDTGLLWTGGSEAQVLAHMLLDFDEDIPFLTIDTGNQFESVYDFRERFASENDFEWLVRGHEELLRAIESNRDPRDYHGQWNPSAHGDAPLSEDEWTVERSCGQLKVVPMKSFINQDGFTTLITGQKRNDAAVSDDLDPVSEEMKPATHTRINPLYDWTEEHVWAYLTFHFVEYPNAYDNGYRHTDAKCCTGDDAVSEHGGEGFDPELEQAKERLQDMGYV